ncbi:MAG: SIS domain-containing protein, partial [Coleofasciculaceae cyanobacterium]
MPSDQAQRLRQAQRVLRIEAEAVASLADRLDEAFETACQLCLACKGRIVVTGMGKSGHVAGKIAATLASTGSPAFFLHPGEASHGDLGMITQADVVLAISYSGETQEVLTILPLIKRLGAPLISMTGNPQSTLALRADAHLNVRVAEEACPLNLAPTASTTATLAC